ncbi:hypothetical protein ACS5NO_13835 [Larkinella sp. GY13]|uniref:hypothetical protein n=1 Tax=Larkinella sp. GY13 TaxID=3453720 RepID=UPI003EEE1DFD
MRPYLFAGVCLALLSFKTKAQQVQTKGDTIYFNSKPVLGTDSIPVYQVRNYIHKEAIVLNSEQSYLTLPFIGEYHFGNNATHKNYALTGNPSPRFFFFQGIRSRFLLEVFIETQIRILKNFSYSEKYRNYLFWDLSSPVRTPGYKPGATLYIGLGSDRKGSADYDKIIKLFNNDPKVYRFKYLTISAYHYSNGQDGKHDPASQIQFMDNAIAKINSVEDYLKKGYRDKVAAINKQDYLRKFNVYNGNFAVDLILAGGITFNRKEYAAPTAKTGAEKLVSGLMSAKAAVPASGKTTYDVQVSHYIGLQIPVLIGEDLLKRNSPVNAYGMDRIVYRFQHIADEHGDPNNKATSQSVFEKRRFIAKASFAFNALKNNPYINGVQRFNVDLRYHFSGIGKAQNRFFQTNSGSYFIGAGWKGQDDYNIYFEDSFPYVNFGIAYGFKTNYDQKINRVVERLRTPQH